MHTDIGGHEMFKLSFWSKIFCQIKMGRQDWTFMIKFVTARDSSAYECQVIWETRNLFCLYSNILPNNRQAYYTALQIGCTVHSVQKKVGYNFVLGFWSNNFVEKNMDLDNQVHHSQRQRRLPMASNLFCLYSNSSKQYIDILN